MGKQVKKDVRKRGIKELLGGVAVAALGIIMSVVSYNTAKAGETYTVYTGIIVLGIAYACKGVYDVAFPNGLGKKKDNEPIEAAKEAEEVVVEED